jgi:hypothetical protein
MIPPAENNSIDQNIFSGDEKQEFLADRKRKNKKYVIQCIL